MNEVEYATLQENVVLYRTWIVDFLRNRGGWRCGCCGQARPLPPDGWRSAHDLMDALRIQHGTAGRLAVDGLLRDGLLEIDPRLRVRIRRGWGQSSADPS